MNKNYLSWTDAEEMFASMADFLSEDKPDMVVGLARGGLVPAVWLSHKLGVPMEPIQWTTRDGDAKEHNYNVSEAIADGKQVVFVDDINDSGVTLEGVLNHYDVIHVETTVDLSRRCRYVTMMSKGSSVFEEDYSAYRIPEDQEDQWVVFPWEKA